MLVLLIIYTYACREIVLNSLMPNLLDKGLDLLDIELASVSNFELNNMKIMLGLLC